MKKIILSILLITILILYGCKSQEMIDKESRPFTQFEIAEVTDIKCNKDSDCETPMDYLIRSSCPYTSICEDNKCTIICPEPFETMSDELIFHAKKYCDDRSADSVFICDGFIQTIQGEESIFYRIDGSKINCPEVTPDSIIDDCKKIVDIRASSKPVCEEVCSKTKVEEELIEEEDQPVPDEDFCGSSTRGPCETDSDCQIGGCSGQICQSKQEERIISTCEYAFCYNAASYGLSCRCINNECVWN